MKKLLLVLTSLLIIGSCQDYQERAKNLGSDAPTIRTGADAGDILDGTTNDNSLSENMQLFLDNFLIPLNDSTADTLVDYENIYKYRERADVVELRQNILTQIAKMNYDELTKNEKIAFLINSYNYLAIHTVISNYILPNGSKIKSIIDIGGEGSFSAFSAITYNVTGKQMSLDDIEKGTLKPLLTHSTNPFKIDARFHFAVICAAKGCPILMQEAYTAENINSQLEQATLRGLELKRNLEITASTLEISSLFDWYSSDFENHALSIEDTVTGSNRNFIKIYQPEADLSLPIKFINYDWLLNIGTKG